MENCFLLDFEKYAEQKLNSEQLDIIKGLQVVLYLDPKEHAIHKEIYMEHGLEEDELHLQLEVLNELTNSLYEDEEIKSLLWRFLPLSDFDYAS